jgi:hypothetical protein
VRHTLVIYRASERADARLRELVGALDQRGSRLTVVALAVEEPVSRRCCDTRSVLWNGIKRELAEGDLARARLLVEGVPNVELEVLRHGGRRVAEAVIRQARLRGVDEIVVADPKSCGLSRRERRSLGGAAVAP